jgi:hypothetical protein
MSVPNTVQKRRFVQFFGGGRGHSQARTRTHVWRTHVRMKTPMAQHTCSCWAHTLPHIALRLLRFLRAFLRGGTTFFRMFVPNLSVVVLF